MDSVKPIRHTEICNFCSISEKNDVARFCITLQCGKNKEKHSPFPVTMKRIVVAFFYAVHLPQGHMQCLSRRHQVEGKGTAGVSAMLLVTTVQYVFIIILMSLLKSVPGFCRYFVRYKYL
jgi:hypothetical protein